MSQTTTTQRGFQYVLKRRSDLLALIERHLAVVRGLDLDGPQVGLLRLKKRVATDDFKVLVLGDFRRGKSTLINAMLGEKVLPSQAIPTTAIINEVKWGEDKRARVHYRSNGSEPARPPKTISIRELDQYVAIQRRDQRVFDEYEKVEIQWPLEFCRNGVEFIDSPGLNDIQEREKITIDYLSSVDAVLFVMMCDSLAAKNELSVVQQILWPAGHRHLFFICNKINVIPADERHLVREEGIQRLAPHTLLGTRGIFFIDAKGALDARINGDPAALGKTGIPELEEELERFLTEERGKIKLLAPTQELLNNVHDLRTRRLPDRKGMLAQELNVLEQRVAEQKQPLERLEAERNLIVERISTRVSETSAAAAHETREFLTSLADDVPGWLKEFQPQTRVKMFEPEKVNALAEEMRSYVSERIEERRREWHESHLEPLVSGNMQKLAAELDERASAFLAHVDQIRLELSGDVPPIGAQVGDGREVSAGERLLAAAGGWVIAGPGAAVLGGQGGFRGMGRALIPQLAIGIVALTILNLSLPVVGALLGVIGLGKAFSVKAKAEEQVRNQVTEQIVDHLRSSAYVQSEEISKEIAASLNTMRDAARDGLDAELAQLREHIDVCLAAKREGEEKVRERREELERMDRELGKIDGELTQLVADLAVL